MKMKMFKSSAICGSSVYAMCQDNVNTNVFWL